LHLAHAISSHVYSHTLFDRFASDEEQRYTTVRFINVADSEEERVGTSYTVCYFLVILGPRLMVRFTESCRGGSLLGDCKVAEWKGIQDYHPIQRTNDLDRQETQRGPGLTNGGTRGQMQQRGFFPRREPVEHLALSSPAYPLTRKRSRFHNHFYHTLKRAGVLGES